MESQWYIQTEGGGVEGPLAPAMLKARADSGTVKLDTLIRKGAEGKWVAANKVRGLFAASPPPTPTNSSAPLPSPPPLNEQEVSNWLSAPQPQNSGLASVPPRQKSLAPLVRRPSVDAEADAGDHRLVPVRRTALSDVVDAKYAITSPRKKPSPLLLVGTGVGGTLLVVGLVAVAFSAFSKKADNKPQQQQVVQNPNETQKVEPPPAKNESLVADPATSTQLSAPEATVKSYLAAATWEGRLPYVVNADRVRPEMAKLYRTVPRFTADNFLPGTIVAVENRNAPVGERCTVTVDVSKSYPDIPRWTYIIIHTAEGFKVDWEATQEQSKKELDAANQARLREFQAKLRELNPVIDIEILRCEQEYSRTKIEFNLTNRSTALFPYVAVTMSIQGAKGEYLGSNYTNETNVRAGQSVVKSISFENVKVGEVAAWKMDIKDVKIDRGDGQHIEATSVFKLNEHLAGSDKSYQKRLESRLVGHWRDSGEDHYFPSAKAEAVFVDKEGIRRVFSYSVVERNYSAGTFQLRFVSNEGTGHQRSFTIKDKTMTTQPTHVAFEVGEWRELKDEAKGKLTVDWTYIDEREAP